MNSLQERVKHLLATRGLTQAEATRRGGFKNLAFINDIVRGHKADVRGANLDKLAQALGTTEDFLLGRTAEADPRPVNQTSGSGADLVPNISFPAEQPPLPQLGGPRNVPVLGTAYGGDDGDFRFNGNTDDYVPRPRSLEGKDKVYSIYVRGQSMEPKYEEGESIYVDPVRPPQIGDYVIVELLAEEDGEPGAGFLKRLVKRTPTRIVVSQFNPAKEIEFERDRVKALHRVIPYSELLGV
ncbi:XRE family transcriptional regulator [Salinarimonas soli]|uniref:Helix-turn-helix transcriptional regulator n=1 Tax=Salinarimonas soli TaxID=1638099 RepID=A0A5B2VGF1_9HYPH|nr:XRE family transcriptional regulator [Salinarimonas soli]KAA2237708.1 helix-turn-helix transcriptional regulator [Salinarimonas soli]